MLEFSCIAHLEREIENAVKSGNIATGIFGRWQGGTLGNVEIVGRWRSKGIYGGWCVRWRTIGLEKSLFSKGLAGYPCFLEFEKIAHLPVVK